MVIMTCNKLDKLRTRVCVCLCTLHVQRNLWSQYSNNLPFIHISDYIAWNIYNFNTYVLFVVMCLVSYIHVLTMVVLWLLASIQHENDIDKRKQKIIKNCNSNVVNVFAIPHGWQVSCANHSRIRLWNTTTVACVSPFSSRSHACVIASQTFCIIARHPHSEAFAIVDPNWGNSALPCFMWDFNLPAAERQVLPIIHMLGSVYTYAGHSLYACWEPINAVTVRYVSYYSCSHVNLSHFRGVLKLSWFLHWVRRLLCVGGDNWQTPQAFLHNCYDIIDWVFVMNVVAYISFIRFHAILYKTRPSRIDWKQHVRVAYRVLLRLRLHSQTHTHTNIAAGSSQIKFSKHK